MNFKSYLFVILILVGFQNQFSQGLNFTSEEKISEFKQPDPGFGFTDDLPYSYSLERYVPTVREQKGGTCVGFSTFYYALSTMYNIQFGITNSNEKFANSFDPYFIYSIVFNNVNNCDDGLYFYQAFESVGKIGTKKLLLPPYTNCNESWNYDKLKEAAPYTMPYTIDNAYSLDVKSFDFIEKVKRALNFNLPVVVGASYMRSMGPYSSSNVDGVNQDGLWKPKSSETSEGGHALCVVGYDDFKYGGAFRIVNSWGRNYGDNGYMWVKYQDFKNYVKEAYFMTLNKNVASNPSMKEGIKETEFRRFGYRTDKYNLSTYEGQYLNNSVSGYGIWYEKDSNTFYAGKFNDSKMDGFFLILDSDGLYSAVGRGGKFYDLEKLGFANQDSEENTLTQMQAGNFFGSLGVTFDGIRKSTSAPDVKIKDE